MTTLTGLKHHTSTGAHLNCGLCGQKVSAVFQVTDGTMFRWLCGQCAFAATGQSHFKTQVNLRTAIEIELPSGDFREMNISIFEDLSKPIIPPPSGVE